jgi:hypothetical protein
LMWLSRSSTQAATVLTTSRTCLTCLICSSRASTVAALPRPRRAVPRLLVLYFPFARSPCSARPTDASAPPAESFPRGRMRSSRGRWGVKRGER